MEMVRRKQRSTKSSFKDDFEMLYILHNSVLQIKRSDRDNSEIFSYFTIKTT